MSKRKKIPSKEQVYDAEISPLMAQVIAICKRRKIPVLASFGLDAEGDLHCTTILLEDEYEPSDRLVQAARFIVRGPSPLMITTRGSDGKIKSMEAVLP